MKEDLDFLLSDKFVEFSHKIAKIHQARKTKKEEIKKLYDQLTVEINKLDMEAKKVQEEWEAWKQECLKNTSDG